MNNNTGLREDSNFNHHKAGISDRLALCAELCHLRRHLLRSAVSVKGTDDEVFYLVMARRCQDLRRRYMQKHFSDVPEELWCAVKAACCIRQLSYEVWDGKDEMLGEFESLCDEIFTKALNEDMQGCAVCREDKERVERQAHWDNISEGLKAFMEKPPQKWGNTSIAREKG